MKTVSNFLREKGLDLYVGGVCQPDQASGAGWLKRTPLPGQWSGDDFVAKDGKSRPPKLDKHVDIKDLGDGYSKGRYWWTIQANKLAEWLDISGCENNTEELQWDSYSWS